MNRVGGPVGRVAFAVAGIAAAVALRSVVVACAVVIVAVWGPRWMATLAANRRRSALEAQLAPALDRMARHLAAGASLGAAIADAATAAPEPLGGLLVPAVEEIRLGRRGAEAFDAAASHARSPVFELAAATLLLHQRFGGESVTVLRRVATVVRERRAAGLEVRMLTAQARASALVLVAVPALTALLLGGRSGISTAGAVIDAIGWALLGLGAWLLWRMSSGQVRSHSHLGRPPARALVLIGRCLPSTLRAGADRSVDPDRAAADAVLGVVTVAVATVGAVRLVPGPTGIVAAVVAGAGAWVLPQRMRRRTNEAARRDVEDAIAQACDLVSLALTAGCDVPGAFVAAAPLVPGDGGERFRLAAASYKVGARFDDALDELGAGIGSDTVDEFCAVLSAARRDGGATAEAVAAFGSDVRLRARLAAQTEARTLPVRLLFPLVFCVLPAFVLLTIVPLLGSALSDLQW